MRGVTKLLLLSLLVVSGCLPDECGIDCNRDGDPDCRADIVNLPTSLPASPPPLTLQCVSRNSRPDTELEWELVIGGGTPPHAYTLDFGDETDVHTGTWSGVGSNPGGFHEYAQGGDFQVMGQVRDAAGQTRSCTLAYTAPDPDLRVRCEATPTAGTAPLTVRFDVTRRDGCIGPCVVTWYFGDGETFEGGHAIHTYEFPGPSGASSYAAFAELRDSTDRVDQCRRPIQVLPGTGGSDPTNHPPSIDTFMANPSSITAGQSATISGTTSDPDPGDTVTWQLTFDSPDAGTLSPTTGTGPILSTYTSSPTGQGNKSIRVTAVDSFGALAPYRTVTVFLAPSHVNQPPVIVSLTASPSVITPGGGPAQIAATITDPDGDPLTWTLALDPSSTATGSFSATSGSGNVAASFSATAAPGNQGTAVIRLTAADPGGLTATRTVNVLVTLAKQ